MKNPVKIFVAEDNEWYNKLLVHNLSLNPDYKVSSFRSGKEVLDNIGEQPDIITLDYRLPDIDGKSLLKKVKEINPEIQVIMISEQDDIETAVSLLKDGAYDYITKTKEIRERLFRCVDHILENRKLNQKISVLQNEVEKKYKVQNTIIGQSGSMQKLMPLIAKATQTDIIVSITGETGTGKEVVAKSIHYNSPRKKGPFIAVNMAALPSELIESELFGHEKGSFTGANVRRKGKFEEAECGTILLDEIGEMDFQFQAKILRVLQEHEFVRIGSNKPIETTCRIIVSTNKDLAKEVGNGKFRRDLYYRLLGIPIHLPALKERGNDVLLLAKYFINGFSKKNNLDPKELTEAARNKLLSFDWPGNVRELKSVVELAIVMSSDEKIDHGDITFFETGSSDGLSNINLTLREHNRHLVRHLMKIYNDNTKRVAEHLDIGQTTVYSLLKESHPDETYE